MINLSLADYVAGTIVNPNDSSDVRDDDSHGSKTNGKIYSEATMLAIVEQYSALKAY
jgi:hypothetical protein